MEPNLLVGDRLFVSKYTYGYSMHSFPFSPKIFKNRIFEDKPKLGDVIVFKTPADNRTDYIKRIIGLPGDSIQFIEGELFLNNEKIKRTKKSLTPKINCGNNDILFNSYEETLPNGKKYIAVYRKNGTMLNSDKFITPDDHYFFLGDNRDCSKDSRFLSSVGFVNSVNLVGKARIIFLSNDKSKGNFFQFWKWGSSIRFNRFFKRIE